MRCSQIIFRTFVASPERGARQSYNKFQHGIHSGKPKQYMYNVLFAAFFGVPEGMLIFLAVLLLFGGKKIPELMRGIGSGIREFNSAKASVEHEIKEGIKEQPRKEKTEAQ